MTNDVRIWRGALRLVRQPEAAAPCAGAICLVLVCVCAFFASFATLRAADLEEIFRNPPEEAKPWVFWYWHEGAVSKEGITVDLEAMKENGIGGAYLMPVYAPKPDKPKLYEPVTTQLSPRYWEMLRFAINEADRIGVKIALHGADGFATAGGPWITPELSMQRVTWSEIVFDAGTEANGKKFDMKLPLPPTKENYYRDIAVLAFPAPEGTGVTTRTVVPRVTTDIQQLNAQGLVGEGVRFRSEVPCWALYEFTEPFTCRSITMTPGGSNYHANRLIVEVSDDGKNFRSLGRLEEPRHGWQDKDADTTHAILPTTAKFFRFVFNKEDMEPGAEDLDSAKWPNRLLVNKIELSSEARIPHYEGKSGVVWRRSSRATDAVIPGAVCVPRSGLVNLTGKMRADGTLDWNAPPGRWIVMRFGHTSTGHKNETAGGGIGLECDKFNEAAVRKQFDGWLGESVRQIGPDLAKRVVKIFHTDSWEAGSQNWSPVFAAEFRKRRGYDPVPWMPVFAGVPVASADASERFLFDVRQTITDLTSEVYFATMVKLAHEHGCQFSCENVAPTMMGDGMRHFGEVDIPMGEFWLRSLTHDKPNDMSDAISAAHVYGKNIVQAEAFTELRLMWDEHPGMLKSLGDLQFARGINRFVFHVFMHNPEPQKKPGVTLNGVGLFFQPNQTWWKPGKAWVEYITRCQALLQQGRPVKDVAYFTGEELPSRSFPPDKMAAMPPALQLPDGYSADSINRDALVRLAKVERNRLRLPGGVSYGALVLPESQMRMMTPELAAKIGEFIQQGLPVLATGGASGLPEKSLSLSGYPECDAEVKRVIAETWLNGKKKVRIEGTLAGLLTDAKVQPDLLVEERILANDKGEEIVRAADSIEWAHRNVRGSELYFVSNQKDARRYLQFSIRGNGRMPEIFFTTNGDVIRKSRVDSYVTDENGRTNIQLMLEANESVFLVYREKTKGGQLSGMKKYYGFKHSINGPWQVTFDKTERGPAEAVIFGALVDWTTRSESSIHNYSGTAVYRTSFEWTTEDRERDVSIGKALGVWLDLGSVANIAEVRLNGKPCGTIWAAPWRLNVADAIRVGKNELEIHVTNTWANRLIGDQALPESERPTWTNAPFRRPTKDLLPSGLLGPVRVWVGADR